MRLFLTKKNLQNNRYVFTEERLSGLPHTFKWGHVAGLLLGSAGICWTGGAYADDVAPSLTIDNSNSSTVNNNFVGAGSIIQNGSGATTLTGTSVLMGKDVVGSALPHKETDPTLGGSVIIRDGAINIQGSGANNGDLAFNASQNGSVAGNIVDKTTGAVVGTVSNNGTVTAVGDNASRLQGFVANNGYTIVGQGDRGNLTLSKGAVLA
ncbi:hypothetical protein GS501_01220, partial [Saccharibacter sp. 17.LH.SD]|uniref:hypothetical protein n=1 Tax=Saccharibacter sp. 17.LH.SD TaxID=2689393 RepID=UPI00136C4A24